MNKAWDEFDSAPSSLTDSFTTQFRYPIEEGAVSAVNSGLAMLRRCAPYVVVFNPQFRRIEIQEGKHDSIFEVTDRAPMSQAGLQTVTVRITADGVPEERKYLLAEGESASVTIPSQSTDDGSMCLSLDDTPRLFLGFPLIGTESFSFPSVINSFGFTPTEGRNGVFLGQNNNDANLRNQAIMEEACQLHVKLLEAVATSGWSKAHILAEIPQITGQEWLNTAWLQDKLGELVRLIRQTPSVRVADNLDCVAPQDSILPRANDISNLDSLWDLASAFKDLRSQLPIREEVAGWQAATDSWAKVLDDGTNKLSERLDGLKLALWMDSATRREGLDRGALASFSKALAENTDPIEWLNRLYDFLKADGYDALVRNRNIILNQAGYFATLNQLYRDNDIDDELKDIGDDYLQMDVRASLRDTRLHSIAEEIGMGEHDNAQLLQKLISTLGIYSISGPEDPKFVGASPRVFAWLAKNHEWEHLANFAAFAREPGDNAVLLLPLGSSQESDGDANTPLAPIKAWPKELRQYADLFSWQNILSNEFYDSMPDIDIWQRLSGKGFVSLNPLVKSESAVTAFLPSEPLPEGGHRTREAVAVSNLRFIARDRTGIMARVRDNRDLARLLWRFMTEWLVAHDSAGLQTETAECECGKVNRYYPAAWLTQVVRNRWVPMGNNVRVNVSAESLASLLRDSDWTLDMLRDNPATAKLLEAIRVQHFDLARHWRWPDPNADGMNCAKTLHPQAGTESG